MKSTVLSFTAVIASLAFGCATPTTPKDHPPVEPYSTPSNNPTTTTPPAEPAPATPPPTATTPPSGTSGSGDVSSNVDSLRTRKDAIISELYGEYRAAKVTEGTGTGGSYAGDEAHANRVERDQTEHGKGAIEQDTKRLGQDIKEGVHETVTDADRAAFAMRCESVGKGETPIWAGDDASKQFFARDDVKAKCAQAASIQREINDVKRH